MSIRAFAIACNSLIIIGLSGCGITTPRYIDYGTPAPSTPAQTACAQAALTAFTGNIAPSVNNTCSAASCHASIAKLKLTKSSDSANRTVLKTYTAADPSKLANFIVSSSHPGRAGAGVAALTLTLIKAWIDEENKCVE